MTKLPNGERAYIDSRKLTDYVLAPDHRIGRHKARVFAAALGLREADAPALAAALSRAAVAGEAELLRTDIYGAHYAVLFMMQANGVRRQVRSLWVIRAGEDFPRFVSAFVAKQD